ncbi:major facilitator superfamily domain-containing protein [Microdochium bolleyi]|uniref:Major facilitator superfamily domain-containing protein n=1 Tax=Microdochium bolleyi TaxID=196109 RepID=A0A136J5E0_9PEZI|nr:major facilitator superfamily domain-containing protein [Microdochium bolleyi]
MLWVLNFLPIFWGFAFDRFGPKWLLWGGSLLYVFGLMMVSLSTEYWHFFLAQGLVCPIGASAVNTAGMSSLVTWFHRRRALVFGIMMAGSSVGGIVLPIMIPKLISSVGFPWAMRAVALVFLALLTVACLTITSRLTPATKPVDMRAYVRGVREPAMLSTVSALFLVFWGIFLPYNFVILQARSQGMSAELVIYLLPILHSAGLFGRFISGVLADRLGRYNVMIIITMLSGISGLALWVPISNDAGVITFMAVFGLLSSGISSLAPTLIAQISDIREIGARTGTAFAVQSFGLLTGSPIASAIVDATGGNYVGLQLFCGFSIFASGMVFAVARWAQAGFRMEKV